MQGPERLHADVLRITAPNPGPMTFTGTQTYLVGRTSVAVIDPGPDDEAHVAAIRAAAPGPIETILVTHAHRDHSGAVPALKAATGAEVLAFGPAAAGRSPLMERLAAQGGLGGGEGVDAGFAPDRRLVDGERVSKGGWSVLALHTPGHLSSHMSFVLEGAGLVFTGDTLMGWSSTLISPPDGSVRDFMASMDGLIARPERRFLPGHGEPIEDGPAEAVRQAAHRRAREAQVLEGLEPGPSDAADLTRRIYHDIPSTLHPAAMRNVLAHLIDLAERGLVRLPEGPLQDGVFTLQGTAAR